MTAELLARWKGAWPAALEAWSAYTLLREPRFLEDRDAARSAGMIGQIAAIRLSDHAVMINVKEITARGLEDHALAILAHEIGHHVYVPANLTDNARLLAAIGRMLGGLSERTAPMVANLYADLLINDRLQRRAGVDIAAVYRKLEASRSGLDTETWKLYTRACEHLWRLPPGTLGPASVPEELDADAMLVARLIRSFAGDWLRGARRFAVIFYRYLAADEQAQRGQTFVELGLSDTPQAGRPAPGEVDDDAIPDGLTGVDPSEIEDDEDDEDDMAGGAPTPRVPAPPNTVPAQEGQGGPGAQHRAPFKYGALLKSLGLDLDQHQVTSRYYRERALPHLIPFPARRGPRTVEPLAEGHEEWGAGDPLEALDLFGSVVRSPRLLPGVTTVQRVYGETPGAEPARVPMDLDVYVDCSGSMPNPAIDVSYLALAATILSLSALRAGARVQATLWSSPGVLETTRGFIRDERRIVGTVTGYISGGTAFPIHVLRDTYDARKPADPPAHIVVISDDGCDTMLRHDERGNDGAAIAKMALARARGGGTLVLNLPDLDRWRAREPFAQIGYKVHAIRAWDDLVAFARAFVRENYGDPGR